MYTPKDVYTPLGYLEVFGLKGVSNVEIEESFTQISQWSENSLSIPTLNSKKLKSFLDTNSCILEHCKWVSRLSLVKV